jgi:Arc/MetJ-type ribon-helix-helix transcriptional regulator
MNGTRSICLPEELCRAAEQRFAGRFSSVDELVANLLQELLRDDASKMDEHELEIIEHRLRGLGYV